MAAFILNIDSMSYVIEPCALCDSHAEVVTAPFKHRPHADLDDKQEACPAVQEGVEAALRYARHLHLLQRPHGLHQRVTEQRFKQPGKSINPLLRLGRYDTRVRRPTPKTRTRRPGRRSLEV